MSKNDIGAAHHKDEQRRESFIRRSEHRVILSYGRLLPDLDFTKPTSVALMVPFTTTSDRNVDAFTVPAEAFSFVWATSLAVTVPLPPLSPDRMPIGTMRLPMLVPSLTFERVTPSLCTSVTPVRFTVTVPPLTVKVEPPVPGETAAFPTVTGFANVTTI